MDLFQQMRTVLIPLHVLSYICASALNWNQKNNFRFEISAGGNGASVSVVRQFVSSNFGLNDPNQLDDNFNFLYNTKKVPKAKYLNIFQKDFSALLRAAPDFGNSQSRGGIY